MHLGCSGAHCWPDPWRFSCRLFEARDKALISFFLSLFLSLSLSLFLSLSPSLSLFLSLSLSLPPSFSPSLFLSLSFSPLGFYLALLSCISLFNQHIECAFRDSSYRLKKSSHFKWKKWTYRIHHASRHFSSWDMMMWGTKIVNFNMQSHVHVWTQ